MLVQAFNYYHLGLWLWPKSLFPGPPLALLRIPPELRRIPPPEAMTAVLCRDVDRRTVIAGGVTIANFPQVARNLRRSSLASMLGEVSAIISSM